MKTEIKNRKSYNYSKLNFFLSVIILFAAIDNVKGYDSGYDKVEVGKTLDVSGVEGFIDVYGTLNLYSGADVGWIYALPGSTINFYGGDVGGFILVYAGYYDSLLDEYIPDPIITVYGTNFVVDGDPCEASATEFTLPWDYLYHTLTGNYGDGKSFTLTFWGYRPVKIYLAAPDGDGDVDIDIKPGSDTNVINLKSKGVVPVAILTTVNFDAGTVDPETVLFAEAAPVHWTLEDVDGDGDKDLMLHFRTQELNLVSTMELSALSEQKSNMSASSVNKKIKLTGKTDEGFQVSGSDSVKIVSSKK